MYICSLVFTKTTFIKKLLLVILAWYLFVNASEKTEWWVELYTHGNTTVEVKRNEYLEYKELLDQTEWIDNEYKKAYLRAKGNEYEYWERVEKFENYVYY